MLKKEYKETIAAAVAAAVADDNGNDYNDTHACVED
jgi:hypothetical protein